MCNVKEKLEVIAKKIIRVCEMLVSVILWIMVSLVSFLGYHKVVFAFICLLIFVVHYMQAKMSSFEAESIDNRFYELEKRIKELEEQ